MILEPLDPGAVHLNELELPEFSAPATKMPDEAESVVLEIESVRKGSFYDGKDEAGDYLAGGWFDAAYGVRGFAEERVESWRNRLDVGYITFDSTGDFTVVESPEYGRPNRPGEVRERVRTIVKLTLLKNRPLDAVISTLRDSGVLGGAEDATAPLSR